MKKLDFKNFRKMNHLFASFGLATLLLISSCNDLLDVSAKNNLTDDIYTTQENVEAALVGAYYSIGGIYDGVDGGELFGGDFMLIPSLLVAQNNSEVNWDETESPTYADFVDKSFVNTNLRIESNWRRAYETINLLNNVLENLEVLTSNQSKIEGEALGLRAILYFEMARFWGPEYDASTSSSPTIPLLTKPINEVSEIVTPTLATLEQIFTLVETDLIEASSLLQSLGKNGTRVSYYACQTYLMRLSMHKGEYGTAKSYADNILDGSYDLTPTPLEAFNNSSNSTEDIFAIQQTISDNAGDINTGTGITNFASSIPSEGLGIMRLSQGLFVQDTLLLNRPNFAEVDIRGSSDNRTDNGEYTADSVTTAFYRNIFGSSTYSTAKFLSSTNVIPVIRLAEIYLARAECVFQVEQNITQESLDDLNEIRTRAGVTTLVLSDFNNTTEYFDSLKIEKKREFLYEGIIFHDLKRWGDDIGSYSSRTPATDAQFIFPIPQSEIDTW